MRSEDGKFDISLDTKEQLIKIGTSKDLGFCKGRKKVIPCLEHNFTEIAITPAQQYSGAKLPKGVFMLLHIFAMRLVCETDIYYVGSRTCTEGLADPVVDNTGNAGWSGMQSCCEQIQMRLLRLPCTE